MTNRLLAIRWTWKKVAILQLVTTLVVVGAIWLGSWVGRSEVVTTQRSACERGQNDRRIVANTNADMDVLADVLGRVRGLDPGDRRTLDAVSDRADERIADVATRLEPALNCTDAFPDPGPFATPGSSLSRGTPAPLDQPLLLDRDSR